MLIAAPGDEPQRKVWLPHEIVWIEAALTLLPSQKHFAIRDIAAMAGVTTDQTRWKMYDMVRASKIAAE